jgi:hypothetical protein
MPQLFSRDYELLVDDLKFTQHRIVFDVQKTLKPDPNAATIDVYNLTDDQRRKMTTKGTPLVRLAAGYKETKRSQIFYGTLIHVQHLVNGQDLVTRLTTGDGIEAYRKKRISATFGPRTQIDAVLRTLIKALGLKPGNTAKVMAQLKVSKAANIYLQGTTLSGSASQELTHLCRSAGLEWSIQDGGIQILNINETLTPFAIRLNKETGLIGSPSVSNKGVVNGKCLITADLFPGRQVLIESRFVKGHHRVEKLVFSGDTHGDDWYGDFEATQLGTSPSVTTPKNKRAA